MDREELERENEKLRYENEVLRREVLGQMEVIRDLNHQVKVKAGQLEKAEAWLRGERQF